MHTKLLCVPGLVLAVALASGCGDDPGDAPTTADFAKERDALAARKNEKAAGGGKKAAKAKAKGKATGAGGTSYATGGRDYFYDPTGKRDPFRSFQYAGEDEEQLQKTAGPLADFELGQLELSAVLWEHQNPRALIIDPGGRSYIVREGSLIGKNNGEVIHIGDNLVLVKETYENFAGERTTKDVELRIRLSQGG